MYRLSLQSFLRQVGSSPTIQEQIDITKRRSRLLTRIVDHQRKAHQYLRTRSTNDDDYSYQPASIFVTDQNGEIDLVTNDGSSDPFDINDSGSRPECFRIALPSGITKAIRRELRLGDIVEVEIRLRIGQCHDALKAIRLALGKKGFLFRTQIRPKGPKTGKTRPWDSIHAVDQTIRLQAQIYRSAREALDTLQAPKDVMERLQVLDRSHLKTSTTLLDPSQSGWKHAQLPWFWYLDVANDSLSSNHMKECKPSSSFK
jgi:hypothetical protein